MSKFGELPVEYRRYILEQNFKGLKISETGSGTFNINGNEISVIELPNAEQIKEMKEKLLKIGVLDRLYGSLIVGDITSYLLAEKEEEGLKSATSSTMRMMDENKRKLGFEFEEKRNNLMTKAITDPISYINSKEADLKIINGRAFETFKEANAKYLEFGYDKETAFHKAKKATEAFKEQLLKAHNEEFPAKLVDEAKQRISISK